MMSLAIALKIGREVAPDAAAAGEEIDQRRPAVIKHGHQLRQEPVFRTGVIERRLDQHGHSCGSGLLGKANGRWIGIARKG
jgi:hypothetical protein